MNAQEFADKKAQLQQAIAAEGQKIQAARNDQFDRPNTRQRKVADATARMRTLRHELAQLEKEAA